VTTLTNDVERSAERDFAISAVATASRVCRRVRAAFEPSEATAKADSSPVTVADLAAQALISMALAEALPSDGLMGEEDSRPLLDAPLLADAVLARVHEERPGATIADVIAALDRCDDAGGPGRRWWTLDPVDGTKGFLRNEQYAVALALIDDGEVVLAVMGAPNLPLEGTPDTSDGPVGCLFIAERGRGAWQVALDGADTERAGDRIVVANRSTSVYPVATTARTCGTTPRAGSSSPRPAVVSPMWMVRLSTSPPARA